MLDHGGKLIQAAQDYNIPAADWLDLSTGINPNPWSASTVPMDACTRLPEDEDGLKEVASHYYGVSKLLPTAGSQATIQALPLIWEKTKAKPRVGILAPSYNEHRHAWQQAGYEPTALAFNQIEKTIDKLDVLVVTNPNNPTGHFFQTDQLLDWHRSLATRGGWLIVDEAFIDATSDLSLVKQTHQPGLIVLRSLGKFFGLAGIRVGFTLAEPSILKCLENFLGPWTITGPSRYVAKAVLQDTSWINKTCIYLSEASQRLSILLTVNGLQPNGGTALFQWVKTTSARQLHQQLAQQGILTRLFTEPSSIRFGLPANQTQWQRLERSLEKISLVAPKQDNESDKESLS